MTYEEMAAKAEEDGRVKKLTVLFVPWEKEGQSVVGRLVNVSVVKSRKNDGEYNQYVFHTEAGMVKFQCGSFFDHEQGALMAIGGIYKITYMGKEKLPTGNSVNVFETLQIGEGMREKAEKEQADLF